MNRYAMSVAVLAVTGSVCAQAVQWTQAEGGNGHWYQVSSELHHSQEASVDALGRGGYLACFESPEEHAWLIQWAPDFPTHYSAWIGLLKTDQLPDPTSGWHWYTGVPASLDWGWGPNEPADAPNIDEWCGAVNRRDGNPYLFFDAACSGMLRNSVIEWSADCNGDGIVDYGQILDGSLEDLDDNGVPDICDLPITIDPYEWSTDQGGNGHWYALLTIVIGPSQSAEYHFVLAESRGGHTATMASAEENEFCFSLNGGLTAFIGVRKEEGTNQGGWITGEPWDYTNWHSGEGTNSWERYANFWGDQMGDFSSQWQDTNLTRGTWSIVEWDADCNGDGIVDYGQIIDGTFDDADGNGVPDCCDDDEPCFPCPGDIVGNDGVVGVDDLLFVIAAYGQTNVPADLDGDGVVDVHDILLILEYWGDCP